MACNNLASKYFTIQCKNVTVRTYFEDKFFVPFWIKSLKKHPKLQIFK